MSRPLVPRLDSVGEYLEAKRIAEELVRIERAVGLRSKADVVKAAVILAAFGATLDAVDPEPILPATEADKNTTHDFTKLSLTLPPVERLDL